MPALLANVPEGIVWGRVTAYVTSFVADGGTELPDGTPDAIPLDGTITLTPTVGVMVFPTLTTPQQAVIQSLVCPVIGGVLYAPGTTPENVGDRDPGVILVASEQPLGQPDRVQYNVTWALEGARVSPPPMTIDVPSQGTVDLATVIPAKPGPGTVIVVSTVDRERAETAREGAEAAADTAETAATVAVTAKNLAEGFAGDAETARDATLTAAAALQDTGWRNISTILDPETWSITTVRLRRHGSLVTFTAQIKALVTTGGFSNLFTIPSGFRPSQPYVFLNPISETNVLSTARAFNTLSVEGVVAKDKILRIQSSWTTSDPFPAPAQYPGTPA